MAVALCFTSTGQNLQKIKAGGYTTREEFRKQNNPAYADSFIITKRTSGDLKFSGANDYKVESTQKTTTKKIIKHKIWGIYKSDTLYLNGIGLTGLIGYAKAEVSGKYCFLRLALPNSPKIKKELGLNDPQYAVLFGGIGGAIQGMQTAQKRIPLIYCIEDGKKYLLTRKTMLTLLENYSDLKTGLLAETNQDNEATLLKYLHLLNEK